MLVAFEGLGVHLLPKVEVCQAKVGIRVNQILYVVFLAQLKSRLVICLRQLEGVGGIVNATDLVVTLSSLDVVLPLVLLQQREAVVEEPN